LPAPDGVVAGPGVDGVVPGAAPDLVVAAKSLDGVAVEPGRDDIAHLSARDHGCDVLILVMTVICLVIVVDEHAAVVLDVFVPALIQRDVVHRIGERDRLESREIGQRFNEMRFLPFPVDVNTGAFERVEDRAAFGCVDQ
jgi:hypothetical protein